MKITVSTRKYEKDRKGDAFQKRSLLKSYSPNGKAKLIMLQNFCNDFIASVPLQLPKLMDTHKMEQPEYYQDYALIVFPVATPLLLEEVMDMLEDEMEMIILYHHNPSFATPFGHSCCAYSNPAFGRMFKINAKTNESGLVDRITVTIYESLEYMSADVCLDLELHARTGHFKYRKPKDEVLLAFI